MASYVTVEQVEIAYGAAFSDEQAATIEQALAEAQAWIERETGVIYNVSSVTNEEHYDQMVNLYTRYRPISAVSSVTGRPAMGVSDITLTAGTDYEVRSLTAGWLYVPVAAGYDRLRVTYTAVPTAPDDYIGAIIKLALHNSQEAITGIGAGEKRVSIGDLTIERFGPSSLSGIGAVGIPSEVQRVIDGYRRIPLA
jgi:hypothetical protein